MLTRTVNTGSDQIASLMNEKLMGRVVVKEPTSAASARPRVLVFPGHLVTRAESGDLLQRAGANATNEKLQIRTLDLAPNTSIYTISRDDFIGATRLLFLDDILGRNLPHGAIVIVPRANLVCVLPLDRSSDASLLPDMMRLLHDVAGQAPTTPSLDAFWFHAGQLDPLNAQISGGTLERISPPPGFTETLAHLPR